MKTKHTQGKWMIAKTSKYGFEVVADKPNTKIHPEVGIKTEQETVICELTLIQDVDNIHPKETEANAKLIASAPELLEALLQCRQWLHDYQDGNEEDRCKTELSWANQAIKKATE